MEFGTAISNFAVSDSKSLYYKKIDKKRGCIILGYPWMNLMTKKGM